MKFLSVQGFIYPFKKLFNDLFIFFLLWLLILLFVIFEVSHFLIEGSWILPGGMIVLYLCAQLAVLS